MTLAVNDLAYVTNDVYTTMPRGTCVRIRSKRHDGYIASEDREPGFALYFTTNELTPVLADPDAPTDADLAAALDFAKVLIREWEIDLGVWLRDEVALALWARVVGDRAE